MALSFSILSENLGNCEFVCECSCVQVQVCVQRTASDIVSQVLSTIIFETGFLMADQSMNSGDLLVSFSVVLGL